MHISKQIKETMHKYWPGELIKMTKKEDAVYWKAEGLDLPDVVDCYCAGSSGDDFILLTELADDTYRVDTSSDLHPERVELYVGPSEAKAVQIWEQAVTRAYPAIPCSIETVVVLTKLADGTYSVAISRMGRELEPLYQGSDEKEAVQVWQRMVQA